MSTSSSIPVLSDVLFYTQDDPYNFQTDNRPLYNLDSNVRHINSSLVGLGYGEHASAAGGLLTKGKVVELLNTGLIRYPIGTTAQLANTGEKPVLGLVIGSTEAGLNRVVWSSEHLDLSSIGLDGTLTAPANGYLLVVDCNDDVNLGGIIHAVASTPSASQIVFGQIKVYPYVTISSFNTLTNSGRSLANTAEVNSHHYYGFTRLRNLLLAIDAGQTPIQYTKSTFYQSDIGATNELTNVMSALLSSDLATISVDTAAPTYDVTAFASKVVKEKYVNFTNATSAGDQVNSSTWSAIAYPSNLTGVDLGSYENYELSPVSIVTPDYSTSTTNLNLFKTFTIEKYYQYNKVSSVNGALSGKVSVTATVFNPLSEPNQGGEAGRIIIWNFFKYDSLTGLEKTRYRVITTGDSANTLFSNSSIFPDNLKAL